MGQYQIVTGRAFVSNQDRFLGAAFFLGYRQSRGWLAGFQFIT